MTIIAWFLIVTSFFSLFSFWSAHHDPLTQQIMARSPLPASAQIAIGMVNLILSLVFGVAILKRRNWARYGYVALGVVGILVGLLTSPLKSVVLISVILLAVFTYVLFRKPANDWFAGAPA